MNKIRRFGILSVGKVSGLSGAFLGLVIGVIYGGVVILIGLLSGASGGEGAAGIAALGIGGGVGIMIGAPIFYGLVSFVFGLLYALILNIVLGWVGGLELEIE